MVIQNPDPISGNFYEVCDCESICACWAEHEPDMGTCTGMFVWDVTTGTFLGSKVAIIFQGNDCSRAKHALVCIDASTENFNALNIIFEKSTHTNPHPWANVINLNAIQTLIPQRGKIAISNKGNDCSISIKSMADDQLGVANFSLSTTGVNLHPIYGSDSLASRAVGTNNRDPIRVGLVSVRNIATTTPQDNGLNIFASTGTNNLTDYRFDIDITGVSAVRGQFTYAV